MSDVEVDLSALFAPSAHVRIYEGGSIPGEMVAYACVAGDGTLEVAGVEDGDYWAIVDGQTPLKVRAEDGRFTRSSDEGVDAIAHGDPKAHEAPIATRDVVTGPRTSANARIKGAVTGAVKKAVRRS